jgi:hypothetical protein
VRDSGVYHFFLLYSPFCPGTVVLTIAAIFIDADDLETGVCVVSSDPVWQERVRRLDPNADVETLNALMLDIQSNLLSAQHRLDFLKQMETSFSNTLQITERKRVLIPANREAIEEFASQLWQSQKPTEAGIMTSKYQR